MKLKVLVPILVLAVALTGCTKKLETENADLRKSLAEVNEQKTATAIQLAKLTAEKDALQSRLDDLKKTSDTATAAALTNKSELEAEISRLREQNNQAEVKLATAAKTKVENQRGDVAGTVTYYFNENYGYKPDAGAQVFIFKKEDYPVFDPSQVKNYLIKKYAAISGDKAQSAAWLEMGSNAGFEEMVIQVQVGKKTTKLDVDGSGSFRTRMKPGHYSVLIKSAHRNGDVPVEITGQIEYQEIDVAADDQANVSVKFLP